MSRCRAWTVFCAMKHLKNSEDSMGFPPTPLPSEIANGTGQHHRTSPMSSSGPRTSRLEIVFSERKYNVRRSDLFRLPLPVSGMNSHSTSRLHRPCEISGSRLKTHLFSRSFPDFLQCFEVTCVIFGYFSRYCYLLIYSLKHCRCRRHNC